MNNLSDQLADSEQASAIPGAWHAAIDTHGSSRAARAELRAAWARPPGTLVGANRSGKHEVASFLGTQVPEDATVGVGHKILLIVASHNPDGPIMRSRGDSFAEITSFG